MTITEAVEAARNNTPIIYESPMEGPILYGRISAIRKDFALREDIKRGQAPESYALELRPINGARSVLSVNPDRVRIATKEELRDPKNYRSTTTGPEVRPELMLPEIREEYEERSRQHGGI